MYAVILISFTQNLYQINSTFILQFLLILPIVDG